MSSEEFAELKGIILGRTDMAYSMGLDRNCVNYDTIYNIANIISQKIMSSNKEFIIGGNVSGESLPFFNKLPYLSKFETRKIIFNATNLLNNENAKLGILKAIEFEKMWLQNKREFYGIILKEDEERLHILETLNKMHR
jgi:viroplasmin and RNaseH domain-containing protein